METSLGTNAVVVLRVHCIKTSMAGTTHGTFTLDPCLLQQYICNIECSHILDCVQGINHLINTEIFICFVFRSQDL